MLFSLGFIGAGMLGVPALAGSAAYAIAEASRLRHASLLHERGDGASFLILIGGALAAGVVLDYVGLTPVRDAVLGGRAERSSGRAAGGFGRLADQRRQGHARARQFRLRCACSVG